MNSFYRTWSGKPVSSKVEYRKPFDFLALAATAKAKKEGATLKDCALTRYGSGGRDRNPAQATDNTDDFSAEKQQKAATPEHPLTIEAEYSDVPVQGRACHEHSDCSFLRANYAHSMHAPEDLAELISAWPGLTAEARLAIVMLLRSLSRKESFNAPEIKP